MTKIIWYFAQILIPVGLLVMFMAITTPTEKVFSAESFWTIRAIDTMKYSRDRAREGGIIATIPDVVEAAAALEPTHIAVGTPYDDEFNRVTRSWTREIHRRDINVWFRGNFSSWEGWFEYPVFETPQQHHQLTYDFIVNNPDIFQDGDIFTPAPEPENGVLGDPRFESQPSEYLDFLLESYLTCQRAFEHIGKQVSCGYFGTNGDIAKEIMTPEIVAELGNVLVIDHYVKDASVFANDIDFLHNKFPQANIIIGEFGAPVPDIHGSLDQNQQARLIADFLDVMYQKNEVVTGVNYWVLNDGTTAITTSDLEPKLAFQEVYRYYNPNLFTAKLVDTLDQPVANIRLMNASEDISVVTDESGRFEILRPNNTLSLVTESEEYKSVTLQLSANDNNNLETFALEPTNPTWWYRFKLKLKQVFENIPRS